MNIHKNAKLTPLGRERRVKMMLDGHTPAKAAVLAGVSPVTAKKWLVRYQAEGWAGLQDRSSRPNTLRQPTPARIIQRIIALRRQRLTGRHIAQTVGVSPATVSRVLKRAGLSRIKDLEPAEPARRYVRDDPGDMIHLDIKKLGRFIRTGHRITGDRTGQSNTRGGGWEYLHVCIDDASRIACTDLGGLFPTPLYHLHPCRRLPRPESTQRHRPPESRPRLLQTPRRHRQKSHDR